MLSQGSPAGPDGGVAAVVTAFDPDSSLVTVCRSVVDQVDVLVVVDDGSAAPDETVFDACAALGATILRQPSNLGIGAALDVGVEHARSLVPGGRPAVLTLDQDSVVPDGYVAALVEALDRARRAGVRTAMVGPSAATGIRSAAGQDVGGVVFSREPIQSGLLFPADALDELGLFDADLFIDGVDTEFYLRALRAGLRAVVAPDVSLEHRLGRRHEVSIAGRTVPLVHAATFRYYYIARNRVALVRRYGRAFPGWAAGTLVRDLRHLVIVTVAVPGRRARLRETVAGLRDGLRGVTGRRPS